MNWFKKISRSVKDEMKYIIPNDVIKKTDEILKEYGAGNFSHEGMVYWGGIVQNTKITITTVFAPKTNSSWGRVSTTHAANFQYVTQLNKKGIVHIAQVHSHPGKSVDHSDGDDKLTAFKTEGLVSIVVPEYCKFGLLPIQKCGFHRYENGQFVRLNSEYVKKHFILTKETCDFEEMRK